MRTRPHGTPEHDDTGGRECAARGALVVFLLAAAPAAAGAKAERLQPLQWPPRDALCGELGAGDAGRRVRLCGWVALRRAHAVHPIVAVEIEVSPWSMEAETKSVLAAAEELGVEVNPRYGEWDAEQSTVVAPSGSDDSSPAPDGGEQPAEQPVEQPAEAPAEEPAEPTAEPTS